MEAILLAGNDHCFILLRPIRAPIIQLISYAPLSIMCSNLHANFFGLPKLGEPAQVSHRDPAYPAHAPHLCGTTRSDKAFVPFKIPQAAAHLNHHLVTLLRIVSRLLLIALELRWTPNAIHQYPRKLAYGAVPRKGDATGRFQTVDFAQGTRLDHVGSYCRLLLTRTIVGSVTHVAMACPENSPPVQPFHRLLDQACY